MSFEVADEFGYKTFSIKGSWFRIIGTRGNAKGLTGTEGTLQWVGMEGDFSGRAWPSSPNYPRVTRVGLKVNGREGYLFVSSRHVVQIPQPTTDEDIISVEIMCHAISQLGRPK